MLTGKRVLVLGLVAFVSACAHPSGGSPPATSTGADEAPRFAVLVGPPDTSLEARFPDSEAAILAGINAFRAKHGLSALTESEDLCRLSRAHATDMVTRNYFNHTNPEGKGPYQRLKDANIAFTAYAATNSYPSHRASVVVADWEAHHGRTYMLDPRFTHAGVGVARNAEGKYRVTATYIRPPAPKVDDTDESGYGVLQAPMSEASTVALEASILRAINALRARHGLSALTYSGRLRSVARAHNKDMFTRKYFSHTDPEHRSPYARMVASNIPFSATGETISYPPVGGDIAQKVIADWLKHPGGKVQVLNPRFTQVGVGVFKDWGKYMYVTAIYLRPPYSPR